MRLQAGKIVGKIVVHTNVTTWLLFFFLLLLLTHEMFNNRLINKVCRPCKLSCTLSNFI